MDYWFIKKENNNTKNRELTSPLVGERKLIERQKYEKKDYEGSIPLEIGPETKDVVYIMSKSKLSENNSDYYLTIAIEFSRQQNYTKPTTGQSDYKGGINNRQSIVIPTVYMQVVRK